MKTDKKAKFLSNFESRGRRIVVKGKEWRYKVGKGGNVIAYSISGERRCSGAWDIKGITPTDFDKGKYNGSSDGMVTPSDVAFWLSNDGKIVMCPTCGKNPATKPHPCPFDQEIGDGTKVCTCCSHCAGNCANSV